MAAVENKAVVRRYFEQVIDGGKLDLLDEIASSDCIIHRPEAAAPITGLAAFKEAVGKILAVYSEFRTTLHDMIAEDDKVVCRLTHKAVHATDWTSRIGRHAVAGKPVSWDAIAIFRLEHGKLAEEWVSRDELGMLIELGALERQTAIVPVQT